MMWFEFIVDATVQMFEIGIWSVTRYIIILLLIVVDTLHPIPLLVACRLLLCKIIDQIEYEM